jgi:hypothetical protein
MVLRFLYFDRFGSFATDRSNPSSGQCPLCTVSDQKYCSAANVAKCQKLTNAGVVGLSVTPYVDEPAQRLAVG